MPLCRALAGACLLASLNQSSLAAAAASSDDFLPELLRLESLDLADRATHRRLARLWRSERLLLSGVRLSELADHGRMRRAALRASGGEMPAADAAQAQSARSAERTFRRELSAYVRRTRQLQPSSAEHLQRQCAPQLLGVVYEETA